MNGDCETESGTAELCARVAARIIKLNLEVPAVFFLEMNKPLTGVYSACLDFANPLFSVLAGPVAALSLREILKDRRNVEQLIRAIEEKAKEQKASAG